MQQELLIQAFKKQQIIIYFKDTQSPQVFDRMSKQT